MHYLILSLLIVCSLSLQAANDTPITVPSEQAVSAGNQLHSLIKDLVYNPTGNRTNAYRAYLAANPVSYEEAHDALRPFEKGLRQLSSIYTDNNQEGYEQITALLADKELLEGLPDEKRIAEINKQNQMLEWHEKVCSKVRALLRCVGNPSWEHFVYFKKQMDALLYHEDRLDYLDEVQACIAAAVDMHIEFHKEHAKQKAIQLAQTKRYD